MNKAGKDGFLRYLRFHKITVIRERSILWHPQLSTVNLHRMSDGVDAMEYELLQSIVC